MPQSDGQIAHIRDTALMTAACRAIETNRPDGLIRDPFAERLAGDRGMSIARGLPSPEIMCFGVGVRSRFLDELVLRAVGGYGVTVVLSLGAGLDTRPWRLDLPAELRWIEVDFAAVLDYKDALMGADRPHCCRERLSTDLLDVEQRAAMFAAVDLASTLMITEGLLMYLPGTAIEAVASSGVRWWLTDITSAGFARRVQMDAFKDIQSLRAEGHLNGEQILDVLKRNGWHTLMQRNYTTDAASLALDRIRQAAEAVGKMSAGAPPMAPPPANDPSGVHLFERDSQ